MVSVLRQLQAAWNDLVPLAQARGIRRVRLLNAPLETIAYRREKLEWLRQQLGETTSHTPANEIQSSVGYDLSAFTFGVELEFLLPPGARHADAAEWIDAAGVPCVFEGYNHTLRDRWKVVTDASLGNAVRGAEAVSPPLRGEAGFNQLRRVCDVLYAHRCKVSVRCGLHVHIGARGEEPEFFKNLIQLYASAEPTIDSFMSPSRRGSENLYCQAIRFNPMLLMAAQTVDDVVAAAYQTNSRSEEFRRRGTVAMRNANRYRKLNLQSYWQHGTVEFRHHQGTVESTKVENWVRFCLKIASAAKEGPKQVESLNDLMDAIKADGTERVYFESRRDHFSRVPPTPTPARTRSFRGGI